MNNVFFAYNKIPCFNWFLLRNNSFFSFSWCTYTYCNLTIIQEVRWSEGEPLATWSYTLMFVVRVFEVNEYIFLITILHFQQLPFWHTHTQQNQNNSSIFFALFHLFSAINITSMRLRQIYMIKTKTKAVYLLQTGKINRKRLIFFAWNFPIANQSIDSIISVQCWSSRFNSV